MSNSPALSRLPRSTPLTTAGALAREFLRPHLAAELVENAVNDLRLLAFEEGMGEINIFGDHHAAWRVLAHEHLEGAGTQDGAQDRIDAVEPPALGETLIDERINAELLPDYAFDNVAKESRLGVTILAAFDL